VDVPTHDQRRLEGLDPPSELRVPHVHARDVSRYSDSPRRKVGDEDGAVRVFLSEPIDDEA
jgi:hypothetical protein